MLKLDRSLQPRTQGVSDRHIRQLVDSGVESWPPLLVKPSDAGDGKYVVIDGWHRALAASAGGLKTLRCVILPASAGYGDAFVANRHHGLPLTTEDRKHYARWLHRQYPDWSLRKLGEESGLNHETVRRALQGSVSTTRQSERRKPPLAEQLVDAAYLEHAFTSTDVENAIELYRQELWPAVARRVVRAGELLVEGGEPYL
jgi:hypothetical protein